jgi:hypothetical protein
VTPSDSALGLHYTQSSCLRTVYELMTGNENQKTDNYGKTVHGKHKQFLYKYNLNYIEHKSNGIK